MTNVLHGENGDGVYEIYQIPCFENSFTYLIASHGVAISIDPGEGGAIQNELLTHSLRLEAILLTHHHKAHVEDAVYLQLKTEATIIGPFHEDLDFVNQEVWDDDECLISPFTVKVIGLPGHTRDHLGFYFPDCKALFSGDALFIGGCGKMIEGSAIEYFNSLQKIKSLPEDTLIFGGHKITEDRVRTLKEEMKLNPFLKAKTVDEFVQLRSSNE